MNIILKKKYLKGVKKELFRRDVYLYKRSTKTKRAPCPNDSSTVYDQVLTFWKHQI